MALRLVDGLSSPLWSAAAPCPHGGMGLRSANLREAVAGLCPGLRSAGRQARLSIALRGTPVSHRRRTAPCWTDRRGGQCGQSTLRASRRTLTFRPYHKNNNNDLRALRAPDRRARWQLPGLQRSLCLS